MAFVMLKKAGCSRWLGMVSLAAGLLGPVLPVHAQEGHAVPGTTVTMTPPEGFAAAPDFAGFAHQEKQGSFLILEFPAEAMGQLATLFANQDTAAAGFAQKGIVITGWEELATDDGNTVPLLHGTQEANGITLDKWMALYGGEKTVMVTFQILQANALAAADVKQAFASISSGEPATETNQLSALPFDIDVVAPFRVIQTLAGSSVLMMAGDLDADPEGIQPSVIVAYSTTQAGVELKGTAEAALKETDGFETAKIETHELVDFANIEGSLIKGTVIENGKTKQFSQHVAIEEDGRVLRMVSRMDEAQVEQAWPAVEEIASSIYFKK
ncbi:hypothetical protein [Aminobacter carboxidus]|uniref:Uncharacterized protein n=1 Tax=Aminobacter carboxidus TaxID=376165 RepID=A0ABR9GRY9_9HYPH|nr:hypothetical protein [Aminobacter carboxidus]MBE1206447.1 hypothetical protein [Aminobacter carboxidus]